MNVFYNKNAPYEFKVKILDALEEELHKYRAIEYDYVLTKDNIDDWIDFLYRAIQSKRTDEDELKRIINNFIYDNY
jgi:hypothetical protein